MTDFYIAPTKLGNGSGSSVSDAASITNLASIVAKAEPGDRVILLADQGDYVISKSLNLAAGGEDGKPITIIGMSSTGQEMDAHFVSTRSDAGTTDGTEGAEVFRLLTGADNLSFENISFSDVSNAFRVAADISNLSIKDVTAENVSRLVQDLTATDGGTATISGLTVENVKVDAFAKAIIDLQYDTHDVVIKNVTGDGQNIATPSISFGIHLDGTVHDVTITDTSIGNIAYGGTRAYVNGDAFATEAGVYNVVFQDTTAYNCADAGYDLKSSSTTLINTVSDGNSRNYRFWAADTVAENLQASNPTYHGGTSLTASNIWVSHGGKVTIIGGSLTDNDGTGLALDLDADSAIALKSVTSDQTDTTGAFLVHASSTSSITGALQTLAAARSVNPITGISETGGSVSENAAAGTVVATFSADCSVSGHTVTYALTSDASGLFTIDAKTGVVTVATGASIDYETATSHKIVVQAADQYGHSVSQTFSVSVANVFETTTITGTANADTLRVAYEAGNLFGGAGNDTLYGGAYDDLLSGGSGNDVLNGGAGNDTATYADATAAVTVSLSTTKAQATGGGGTDTLVSIENLIGSAYADKLVGDANANRLDGGAGDDVLDGKGGADTLVGGLGDDIFVVDAANETVIENAGEGNDSVKTTLASYTLGANIENLYGAGSVSFTGTGNDLDNIIKGTAAGDVLSGAGGADKLYGNAGNDTLVGGSGADWLDGGTDADLMSGGADGDTYIVDNVGDRVVELADQGIDSVRTSLSAYTLTDNVENLSALTAGLGFTGTGNALDNTITGQTGDDTLFGLAGSDKLNGGAGNDTLWGGSGIDYLTGGAGSDRFGFNTLETGKADYVTDFASGVDKLAFSSSVFSALKASSSGSLLDSNFIAGKKALTADQHLIYDKSSGILYYDDDGSGSHAQVAIATLTNKATLSASDIMLV